MTKYTVTVKQIYTYEEVQAKSKAEAIAKVVNAEWHYSDDNIEVTAKKQEEEDE